LRPRPILPDKEPSAEIAEGFYVHAPEDAAATPIGQWQAVTVVLGQLDSVELGLTELGKDIPRGIGVAHGVDSPSAVTV
jgi:hypothetical protein